MDKKIVLISIAYGQLSNYPVFFRRVVHRKDCVMGIKTYILIYSHGILKVTPVYIKYDG